MLCISMTWASTRFPVEPVMADPNEPYAITEGDLTKIFKEYEILSAKGTKNP